MAPKWGNVVSRTCHCFCPLCSDKAPFYLKLHILEASRHFEPCLMITVLNFQKRIIINFTMNFHYKTAPDNYVAIWTWKSLSKKLEQPVFLTKRQPNQTGCLFLVGNIKAKLKSWSHPCVFTKLRPPHPKEREMNGGNISLSHSICLRLKALKYSYQVLLFSQGSQGLPGDQGPEGVQGSKVRRIITTILIWNVKKHSSYSCNFTPIVCFPSY